MDTWALGSTKLGSGRLPPQVMHVFGHLHRRLRRTRLACPKIEVRKKDNNKLLRKSFKHRHKTHQKSIFPRPKLKQMLLNFHKSWMDWSIRIGLARGPSVSTSNQLQWPLPRSMTLGPSKLPTAHGRRRPNRWNRSGLSLPADPYMASNKRYPGSPRTIFQTVFTKQRFSRYKTREIPRTSLKMTTKLPKCSDRKKFDPVNPEVLYFGELCFCSQQRCR